MRSKQASKASSSLAQPGIKREINEQRNKTRSKKIFDRLAAIGGQRLQST